MLNIVVLDGYTLNPGDLSWDKFKELGELTVYDRTPQDKTFDRAKNAEILLTNKTILDSGIIDQLDKLRYIGVLATGYNVVDIQAAKNHNIVVTNIPTYGTDSVAQMVFAHILNFTQRVAFHSGSVKRGEWGENPDFCYWKFPLIELKNLTIGIIGFGKIGRKTAEIANAFGMNVFFYDDMEITDIPEYACSVELKELLSESDFISLNCPLTHANYHLINSDTLKLMKPSAFLINTARGQLVDENALAEALSSGMISGAGVDVLETEPPKNGSPLFESGNCFITPHIAWATKSARRRLMNIAVENLREFLKGNLVNVISN